jgi:hypothetical protein
MEAEHFGGEWSIDITDEVCGRSVVALQTQLHVTGSFLRAGSERWLLVAPRRSADTQFSLSSGGAVHCELQCCRRRRCTWRRCRHLLYYVICLCSFVRFLPCLISPILCKIFKVHVVLESEAYVLCHVVYSFKVFDCVCVRQQFQLMSVLIVMRANCSWLLPYSQALFPALSKLNVTRVLIADQLGSIQTQPQAAVAHASGVQL